MKMIEKKSAIRLINQYAEQYKRIESENKVLNTEINDLKRNLKISKDIIDCFFKPEQKEKSKIFLKKTKEEILLLNSANDRLKKELKELRDKNSYYEMILNESILKYQENIELLQSKIFVLDNIIKKKDAIIDNLNIKISNAYEAMLISEDFTYAKEIYITEPNSSILAINDELYRMKDEYNTLMEKLKIVIKKKDDIMKENETLKKISTCQEKKEKEDTEGNKVFLSFFEKLKKILLDENNKELNESVLKESKIVEELDWIKVLKKAKLSPESLSLLSSTFIGESIEVLAKIIIEKNMQIRIITKENKNVNESNIKLNEENKALQMEIEQLKKEIKSLQQYINNDNFSLSINNESNLKIFEVSFTRDKDTTQYKEFDKYLDEFIIKTKRIDDSLEDFNNKTIAKSLITNNSTLKGK